MTTITVLVEYGDRRKKLILNEAAELMQECKKKFDICDKQNVVLEIMETEFSDGVWIELDDIREVCNGRRLRIISRDESDSTPQQGVVINTDGASAADESGVLVGAIEPAGDDGIFLVVETPGLLSESGSGEVKTDEPDPLSIDVETLSRCSTLLVKESPTPSVRVGASPSESLRFPEESLPLALRRKLHSEEHLDRADWGQLMGAVYEIETNITMFPSGADYERIAQTILDAYPYLGGRLTGYEARAFVKAKVINKFRNSRRKRRMTEKTAEPEPKRGRASFKRGLSLSL